MFSILTISYFTILPQNLFFRNTLLRNKKALGNKVPRALRIVKRQWRSEGRSTPVSLYLTPLPIGCLAPVSVRRMPVISRRSIHRRGVYPVNRRAYVNRRRINVDNLWGNVDRRTDVDRRTNERYGIAIRIKISVNDVRLCQCGQRHGYQHTQSHYPARHTALLVWGRG